ncbi:Membrane protein [Bacillus sp. ZZV12-4809]|nr:Membrane protein [Bacillus sp. ZZV12-4809]
MFKNKLLLTAPIIALAIIFIFSLTLFPSVQPQPKNLPIAIVNEDEGVEIRNQPTLHMGKTIIEMIQKNSDSTEGEDPAVRWVKVKTAEEAQKGMDHQKYYAALIIPKDFSAKQATFKTAAPSSPEIQIYINQGMNTAASTIAGQLLNGIVDNMNNNIRKELLDGAEKQGATLTAKQAASLAAPITKKVTNVNEIGTNSANGNSPVSLFQPLWISSLASAAILFLAVSKLPIANRKENLRAKAVQVLMAAMISLVIGFGLTWLAEGMVGFNIPDFLDTALFLAVTSFSFILMILAVLSFVGIKGIPVFALLLFFGAPLLALAPEMMSPIYREWIYSWLPMRFMIEGLRELFFFGKGLTWSSPLSALVWIGAVSLAIILASALKMNSLKEQTQTGN